MVKITLLEKEVAHGLAINFFSVIDRSWRKKQRTQWMGVSSVSRAKLEQFSDRRNTAAQNEI